MNRIDPIALTRELISQNTINPPGNEAEAARILGRLLCTHGFEVSYHDFGPGRLHLLAEKGLSASESPLLLSGHLDTVPLGDSPWSVDPFGGNCTEDRIYGRGSSDMKSGVAAMTIAAIEAMAISPPKGGVRLVFTAGEELGCQGVQQLLKSSRAMGSARAIIVGEPTANIPAIGHKGGLYLQATSRGKTAHSSMPELGDNAIYKAAKAICKIENFRFEAEPDPLLGLPSINVGKMEGGLNLNSVPDHASFSIDIRSTTMVRHSSILERLGSELGPDIKLETLVDLGPVSTPENHPFTELVLEICQINKESKHWKKALPYLTDGSALQAFYGGVPTIVLGPGEPEMAHQTDEYCFISKICQSIAIYKKIILNRRT